MLPQIYDSLNYYLTIFSRFLSVNAQLHIVEMIAYSNILSNCIISMIYGWLLHFYYHTYMLFRNSYLHTELRRRSKGDRFIQRVCNLNRVTFKLRKLVENSNYSFWNLKYSTDLHICFRKSHMGMRDMQWIYIYL